MCVIPGVSAECENFDNPSDFKISTLLSAELDKPDQVYQLVR